VTAFTEGIFGTMTTCSACGGVVPEGNFCVRCGHPLQGSARRAFAAAPHQRPTVPWIVTTLYPHLPKQDLETFRVALIAGVSIVLVLGLAGLFPVAVIVAAVVVPVLTVLYLYDVDLYEDEPIRVIALTMVWGAVAGIVVALVADAVAPTEEAVGGSISASYVLTRGVVVPIASVALASIGPLALLPSERFNDVLDGATFGAAAGVAFAGALLLAGSSDLLDAGLRPVGATGPWIARLLELALAVPLLFAGAVGGTTAAFWLRYRAPVADRRALGALGHPAVAVGVAFGLVVASALAQIYLDTWISLAVLVLLAGGALLWLRLTIHVGLVQEAGEVPISDEIACPNCGNPTPSHTFCVSCGVSLRALPKGPRRLPEPAPGGEG
jgi:hypothetical protein